MSQPKCDGCAAVEDETVIGDGLSSGQSRRCAGGKISIRGLKRPIIENSEQAWAVLRPIRQAQGDNASKPSLAR